MKALITGSSGTVGSALLRCLQQDGVSCVGWDRAQVPIDDYAQMHSFIERERPDVLFHLAIASQLKSPPSEGASWRVNYEWTSELAWIARELGVRFVFTSTAMVFSDDAPGPFTIASQPDVEDGYGRDKRAAEERVFQQNPGARVARLGWQIGDDERGNQMVAWLAQRQVIEASVRWMPACSLLPDTAKALLQIARSRPGLYQVDSNEGWSFYDIACALRERHQADWEITPSYAWRYDQRLLDARVPMPPLSRQLPQLGKLSEPKG